MLLSGSQLEQEQLADSYIYRRATLFMQIQPSFKLNPGMVCLKFFHFDTNYQTKWLTDNERATVHENSSLQPNVCLWLLKYILRKKQMSHCEPGCSRQDCELALWWKLPHASHLGMSSCSYKILCDRTRCRLFYPIQHGGNHPVLWWRQIQERVAILGEEGVWTSHKLHTDFHSSPILYKALITIIPLRL